MKWKARVKKDLEIGHERWRIKFAWLPVNACPFEDPNDRYWVWLQYYKQKQRYSLSYDVVVGVDVSGWVTLENYVY
jgi:hypothetical protein